MYRAGFTPYICMDYSLYLLPFNLRVKFGHHFHSYSLQSVSHLKVLSLIRALMTFEMSAFKSH